MSKQRVSMMTREKKENCNIASRSRVSNTPLLLYNLKEIKACSRIMGGELMDGVEVKVE